MRKLQVSSVAAAVAAILASGQAAYADEQAASDAAASSGGIEEIVVTAQKREESIQDVPISMSVVSGEALDQFGIQNVSELAKFIPSLRIVQSNGIQNSGVFIRGIGGIGTNQGIEPSVGVFLDGVYLPIPGPIQANLRDISSVEVLRGPQGTLYGRNTPVGAVNINTRVPTQETEASATVLFGNYSDMQFSGFVGGGLTDTLSGRLSGWVTNQDGYEENLASGDDINSTDQYGVRGRLRWEPNEKLTGDFIGYFTRLDSHCCAPEQLDIPLLTTPTFLSNSAALGTPYDNWSSSDHKVEEYASGETQMDITGASATFDYDTDGGSTLTSITAYTGIINDLEAPAFSGLSRPTITDNQGKLDRQSYSQELRFASAADQRWSYLAGIYLYTDDVTYRSRIVFGAGADRVFWLPIPSAPPKPFPFSVGDQTDQRFQQTTDSYAGFGQVKFNATDSLHFTAGGRYGYDKKDGSISQTTTPTSSFVFKNLVFPNNEVSNLDYSDGKFTYSLSASYDFNDDVTTYATYGTGWKSGGFNGTGFGPSASLEFKAETSDTIEVGLKSFMLERRLMLNVDVYHMNLHDFQEATINETGTGFIVGNAGDRDANGVELDAQWVPIDALTLTLSGAYLDAEYTKYAAGPCYVGQTPNGSTPGTCNYKGETPAWSPEWTWSLSGDYRQPIGQSGLVGYLQANASYTDEMNTIVTLDPRGVQPSTTLLGARIGVEQADGRWRVSLYGKNLTDETYFNATTNLILQDVISSGSIGPFPNFAPARGYVGWYAPPRTYGIEATYNF
jgi:iron complex outermembrane receptor protein